MDLRHFLLGFSFSVGWCGFVYLPCGNIHVYLSLTVTSVQVCTASSSISETATDSLCVSLCWRLSVSLCISAPLRSPPDLAALFAHFQCDPDDPHHVRENRCKPHSHPRLCLGDTPKLTADSKVLQRHLSWLRVTSESVLSHSDPVKESAAMN